MNTMNQILGQEHIVSHFRNAVASGKVSHAYILNGEDGCGKRLLAETFAAALLCTGTGDKPCGQCHSCKQAATANHPDIRYITHEKPNTISVDEVREQLNNDIAIRPYESQYKVYIIDEAEKLNAASQNAILKTIEEPPAYAVILLLTNNAASFLPTIMSRCVLLNVKPVPEQTIKNYLMDKLQIPDYQAALAARFADGNVGKAINYSTSTTFAQLKDSVLRVAKQSRQMEMSEVLSAVKEVSSFKEDIYDYMNLMAMWYRDVLLYKATKDVDRLIFKEELEEISRQAASVSFSGLQDIIEAMDKVKTRIRANVNFELTIELLFMTIKEKMR